MYQFTQYGKFGGRNNRFSVSLVVIWLMGLLACALYFLVMHLVALRFIDLFTVGERFCAPMALGARTWRTVQIRQSDLTTAPDHGRRPVLLPKITDWDDIDCQIYLSPQFVHIKRLDILFMATSRIVCPLVQLADHAYHNRDWNYPAMNSGATYGE